MKLIRYISASDRINYGDLLFPIIFKKYFDQDFKFINYGLVESDNSSFGALKTKSYKSLNKEISKNDNLVIGGGEVFFSKWSKLVSFISPFYNFLHKKILFKKFDDKTNFTSYLMGGRGSYTPYVPFFKANTFYITVGGQFNKSINPKDKINIIRTLNESKSLTVRDRRTFESLKKENIKSKLLPDSAILMSKIFNKDKLENLSTIKSRNFDFPFIYLQVALNKGPEDIDLFVKNLSKVAEKRSMKIVCCPIGLAPGHEDDKMLKKMVSLNPSWNYIQPKNLYDIMLLISKSKLYVGTSLHGAITAFAYGIPIVPLNKKIKKLDSFVDTWTKNVYIRSIDYFQIESKVEEAINKWDSKKAKNLLINQQQMVEDYFDEIKKKMS